MSKLTRAERIDVVDSFSEDRNLDIIKQYPQAEVLQRNFDPYEQQWNFGLDQVSSEWVMTLDADYILSDEFIDEIRNITSDVIENGFWISLQFCIDGKKPKVLYSSAKDLFISKRKRILLSGRAYSAVST